MKERVKKERIKDREEVSEDLEKTQRVFIKRELILHEQPSELLTKLSVFKIPVKSMKQLEITQPQTPNLKVKSNNFIKPELLSARVKSLNIIIPTLTAVIPTILTRLQVKSHKGVKVLTPLPVVLRKKPLPKRKLRLSLRPLSNITKPIVIRELIIPKLITSLQVIFKHPHLIPSTTIQKLTTHIPILRPTPKKMDYKPRGEVPKIKGDVEDVISLGLLNLCFEPDDEEYNINGVLNVSPEYPIVILAEKVKDEYLEALKHILREIYRIKVGGLPIPIVTRTDKRKVEEVKAGRRIYVIEEERGEFFKFFGITNDEDFEKRADHQKFLERISELFSQQFGFLIIYAKREKLARVERILTPVKEQIPKLFKVKLKQLNPDEKVNIVRSVWGFVKPLGVFGTSFDNCFLSSENLFWDILEKLETPEYGFVRESVEDEEGIQGYESTLHYLIKVFIVKYFMEKYKLKPEEIKTEVKLSEGVFPDIFIRNKNLVIEIETLYGSGIAPWRRIMRTIEKYERSPYRLWIVIPNLQMSLYLAGISKLARILEKEKRSVEFYTLNIRTGSLVKLKEYIKSLRQKSERLVSGKF